MNISTNNTVTTTTIELQYVIQKQLWGEEQAWYNTEPYYDDIEMAQEAIKHCRNNFTQANFRLVLAVVETKYIPI
jgi:hypothetical protein